MAIDTRSAMDCMVYALVAAHNASQKEIVDELTSFIHSDVTSYTTGDYKSPVTNPLTVSATPAADLDAVISKANFAKAYYNTHIVDALAHKAADTASHLVTAADASDQGTADTLLNSIKAKYNVHRTQSGVHYVNDSTNVVTAPDATDLGTSKTLVDDIGTQLNAHLLAAPVDSPLINVIGA